MPNEVVNITVKAEDRTVLDCGVSWERNNHTCFETSATKVCYCTYDNCNNGTVTASSAAVATITGNRQLGWQLIPVAMGIIVSLTSWGSGSTSTSWSGQ